jgi:peptide-methionine (S)-S-oxide reductase
VVRTRVGYAGGTKENPTYQQLGDHSETIQIDYDPSVISYDELLDVFWSSHQPTQRAWSRQYMSVIFYHDEQQKESALESKAREQARLGQTIYTEVVSLERFYRAEEYHQKYRLRQVPELMRELGSIYPEAGSLVDSTAVARVNGYVGGNGTLADLEDELDQLGLSLSGQELLRTMVEAWQR